MQCRYGEKFPQSTEGDPPDAKESSDDSMPALTDGNEGEPTGAGSEEDPTNVDGEISPDGYLRSPTRPTTVSTILTTAAIKGSTIIEVACPVGMKIGQKIRIGTQIFEDYVIKQVGEMGTRIAARLKSEYDAAGTLLIKTGHVDFRASVQLTTPLARNHGAGSGVILIHEAPRTQGLFPERREGILSRNTGFLFVPPVPNIPRLRFELSTFHNRLCDKVLQASTRNDNEEKVYLDSALTMSLTDARLDVVPLNMIKLDRMLRPELEEKCQQDPSLSAELERIKREKFALGEPFTMMRVLVMMYHNLFTERSMVNMYTIRDLTDVKYEEYGDSRTDLFWNRFLVVLSRMTTPLETKHMRDCLHHEMRKSKELRIPLREYNRKALEERTYGDLRTIMIDFIHERKGRFDSRPWRFAVKEKKRLILGKGKHKDDCEGKGETHRVTFVSGSESSEDESGDSSKWQPTPLFNPKQFAKKKKKCAWYQTKWREGPGCQRGTDCMFAHVMCSTRKEYDELLKPWVLEADSRCGRKTRSANSSQTWVPKVEIEGQPGRRDVVKLIEQESRSTWQSLQRYEKSKEKKARRKKAKAEAKAARNQ